MATETQTKNRAALMLALTAIPLLVVDATAADLIGLVRKGNAEVAGATVKLTPEKPPAAGPERSATSDSKGRFVITGLIPGDYKLSCGAAETSIHVDYANNRAVCNQ